MQEFLNEKCIAGKFSLEKGGQEAHLHVQGVVRMWAYDGSNANAVCRKFIGWNKNQPSPSAKIMFRTLTYNKLHTFHGMLGYVMKDQFQEHFRTVDLNVSPEDIAFGTEIFLRFGAGPLKDRTAIDPRNIFDKVLNFWRFKCQDRPSLADGMAMTDVLTRMIRTELFYPAGDFVVPMKGYGMDLRRAEKVFNMLKAPKHTTEEEVKAVFFAEPRQTVVRDRNVYQMLPSEVSRQEQGFAYDDPAVFMRPADLAALRAADAPALASVEEINRANVRSPSCELEVPEGMFPSRGIVDRQLTTTYRPCGVVINPDADI